MVAAVAAAAALFGFAVSGSAGSMPASAVACAPPKAAPAYARSVRRALLAKRDLWGEPAARGAERADLRGGEPLPRAAALRGGPRRAPADRVGRLLPPVLVPVQRVRARSRRSTSPTAARSSRGGSAAPSLTVSVGTRRARAVRLLPRAAHPGAARRRLPADPRDLVRRRAPESSTGRSRSSGACSARPRRSASSTSPSTRGARGRARSCASTPSLRGLARGRGPAGRPASGRGCSSARAASFDGSAVSYSVAGRRRRRRLRGLARPRGADRASWWPTREPTPRRGAPSCASGARASRAARSTSSRSRGCSNAELGVLVQQIALAWRYSAGNHYEELSFAEALDAAEVMAGYGYDDVAKGILRVALRALPERFTNWRAGEQLVAGALYYRLYRDRRFVEEETPALARLVRVFGAPDRARGGPRAAASASATARTSAGRSTASTGRRSSARGCSRCRASGRRPGTRQLAARSRALAVRLDASLRRAVRRVDEAAARRLALRAGRAARQARAVRSPHRLAGGELLEPRDALRARLGLLRAARRGGRRPAPLPARPRLAAARRRPREGRVAVREPAVSRLRDRPGLRAQRLPVPRRQRPSPTSSCSASTGRWRRR